MNSSFETRGPTGAMVYVVLTLMKLKMKAKKVKCWV